MAVVKMTAADVKRLQAENDALRQQAKDNAAARADLDTELKSLRTALQVEAQNRERVERICEDLKGRLAAVPAQVAELQATGGPRPDEPRWLYPADNPLNGGRLVPDLEAENALHVETPRHWFHTPAEAEERQAEIEQEAVDPGPDPTG